MLFINSKGQVISCPFFERKSNVCMCVFICIYVCLCICVYICVYDVCIYVYTWVIFSFFPTPVGIFLCEVRVLGDVPLGKAKPLTMALVIVVHRCSKEARKNPPFKVTEETAATEDASEQI